jgi:hypothetical protein
VTVGVRPGLARARRPGSGGMLLVAAGTVAAAAAGLGRRSERTRPSSLCESRLWVVLC